MNKKVGLSFRDFENAENKGFSREGRPTFSAQTIEKERLKCIIENRKLIKSVVVPYLKGIETH